MDSREDLDPSITEGRSNGNSQPSARWCTGFRGLVALAGLFYLIQNHANRVSMRTFRWKQQSSDFFGHFRICNMFAARSVIELGVGFLIATPIARVALAALGFHLQRDRLYAVVSLIVLGILIFSFTHALSQKIESLLYPALGSPN